METNNSIQNKLENLEQIFLTKKKEGTGQEEIITSSLLNENTELKKKLREIEQQKRQLGYEQNSKIVANSNITKIENEQLQKEI